MEFARRFTKGNHAFVVCTHIDKAHVHNHIIWSAVDLSCPPEVSQLLEQHPRRPAAQRHHLCGKTACPSWRTPSPTERATASGWATRLSSPTGSCCGVALDEALAKRPADLEALWRLLRAAGVEVKCRGKAITLQAPGLAASRPALQPRRSVFSGGIDRRPVWAENPHATKTPRGSSSAEGQSPGGHQAKLQAGKGAGYAQWAKVFNLKQMAKTLNYLTEHGLLEYAALKNKPRPRQSNTASCPTS